MRQRDQERLTQLLDAWVGEEGRAVVEEQLPKIVRDKAEYKIAKYIEDRLDFDAENSERLDMLTETINREADAMLSRLLTDPAWLRQVIRDHLMIAVAGAMDTYSETFTDAPCPHCGENRSP